MQNFEFVFWEKIKKQRKHKVLNNYDYRRFGKKRFSLQETIKYFLLNIGFYHFGDRPAILANMDKLDWLYHQLDEASKKTLLDIMAFHFLGNKYVKLPINTSAYWQTLATLDQEYEKAVKLPNANNEFQLAKMDLTTKGYPLKIYARPLGAYALIILEQYRYQSDNISVQVEDGDTVIDGGACYGETALYFSYKAGKKGKVFSFEFMPDNIRVLQINLSENPDYASQVKLIEKALWSTSNIPLLVSGSGPGTKVSQTQNPHTEAGIYINTRSVDDLVVEEQVQRIDFIKLDIEGAELKALQGAEETLKRDKPKLAISIYHQIEDFWEIPLWIESLDLGYKFYIKHATIHKEETVLFAVAPRELRKLP